MQSLRDEFKTMKKSSEAGLDQISASDPKPRTSKQNDDLPCHPNTQPNIQASEHTDEPMRQTSGGPALPVRTKCSVLDRIRILNTEQSNWGLFG